MSEQASARLDLVVRRRDRLVEASAVWLFLVVLTYIYWMIVLVLFWGILEIPWWSLLPGLMGTGLLVWWGVVLSRGSLTRARGSVPHLLVTRDEIAVRQVLVWFLLEVPLTAWSGLTVGKHLLGLRVVRLDNGSQRVGLPRATARWLLRIVNGTIGAWAERFTKGDSLGRVASSLSLYSGVGAGTLVVAEGEFRRLRTMTLDERRRAIRETVDEIEAEPSTVSSRAAWISTLVVTVVIVAFFVTL